MLCELCQTDTATSRHHLIPRTLHSNKWFKRRYTRQEMQRGVNLCGDCHRAVHRLVPSEKDLGRRFNSLPSLQQHDRISAHVKWKQRRAPRTGRGLTAEATQRSGSNDVAR